VMSAFGKPALSTDMTDLRLHFSLSHSADCSVIAVRRDYPLGINIERLRDLTHLADVARRFAPSEQRLLAGLTGFAAQTAFFALWTHKEAVVKALGASLAENLDELEFEFDAAATLRMRSWRGDRTTVKRWAISRMDPMAGYIGAIATVHPFHTLKQFMRVDPDILPCPHTVDCFHT
jgi:4'-phosphopantetheinyl transferase